jgi:hypothetical protein
MNKLWDWMKTAIENRPISFVIVGGVLSYIVGFTVFVSWVLSGGFPKSTWPQNAWPGITMGSFIIVIFHWFVARYERRSLVAQVLALIPAIFLFISVTIGAGMLGVKYQSCIVDSDTGEIRACQESWQFVWDRD